MNFIENISFMFYVLRHQIHHRKHLFILNLCWVLPQMVSWSRIESKHEHLDLPSVLLDTPRRSLTRGDERCESVCVRIRFFVRHLTASRMARPSFVRNWYSPSYCCDVLRVNEFNVHFQPPKTRMSTRETWPTLINWINLIN